MDNIEKTKGEWFSLLDKGELELAEEYYVKKVLPFVVKNIKNKRKFDNYDVLVSLVGFTPEVNVVTYEILKPKKLILICSEETVSQADKIQKYCNLSISQISCVIFNQDESEIYDIYLKIINIFIENTDYNKFIFDVSGGKKIMGNQMLIAAYIMNQLGRNKVDICHVNYNKYIPKYRKPEPESTTLYIQTDIITTPTNILNPDNLNQYHIYNKEMIVTPHFSGRHKKVINNSIFTIMPFSESWSNDTYEVVKETCEKKGYVVSRADNLYGHDVLEDIWRGICEAEIIISDITNKNANVMYELGVAHTLGKPVIILTQNINDVPFDLTQKRCLIYQNSYQGLNVIKEKLPYFLENTQI